MWLLQVTEWYPEKCINLFCPFAKHFGLIPVQEKGENNVKLYCIKCWYCLTNYCKPTSGEVWWTDSADVDCFNPFGLLSWEELTALDDSWPGIKDRRWERAPAACPNMREWRWERRESCSWPGIIDARRTVSDGSPIRSSSSVNVNALLQPV